MTSSTILIYPPIHAKNESNEILPMTSHNFALAVPIFSTSSLNTLLISPAILAPSSSSKSSL